MGNLAWQQHWQVVPRCYSGFFCQYQPVGASQSAIAAINAHLGNLRSYPDPDYRELRALSQLHQLPEWILPGNGSAELLTWAGWDLAKLAVTTLVTPAFGTTDGHSFCAKVPGLDLELF